MKYKAPLYERKILVFFIKIRLMVLKVLLVKNFAFQGCASRLKPPEKIFYQKRTFYLTVNMRAKRVDATAAPPQKVDATAAPSPRDAAIKDNFGGTSAPSPPTALPKDNILTIPNLLCVSRQVYKLYSVP
jgi:hypothetical protein